jgi:leucyl aminopeptidase (aminopeptidase T)
MPVDPFVEAGARQCITACLGLEPGQELVIVADETTLRTAEILACAAVALRVPHTLVVVPLSIQHLIPEQAEMSLVAQGAIRQARAILLCVNAQPDCLAFRRHLLETHWSARTRIGHMPGAEPDLLKLANADMERLVADCQCVEVALARGQRLELTSFSPDGVPHHLVADIGGWERLPVASNGLIDDGAWGNVPSGETYIAPLEGTAQGSVCVTGSVPGRVLTPAEAFVVHFQQGRVRTVEPERSAAVQWLEHTQFQRAKAQRDRNWAVLAEIGIGLNPVAEGLTGNPLHDAKAAGTVHIGLGSNAFMGGRTRASIHCDLVIRRPMLSVDRKTLLDRGRLRFVPSEWQDTAAQALPEGSPLHTARDVSRSGVQGLRTPGGRLQRVLRPEPGRVSSCTVGDDETASLAGTLYEVIPDEGDWLSIAELSNYARADTGLVRRVLHVMGSYGLLRFR